METFCICTWALFWWPPFALSIHVAAEGPGEMLIHHAADVTLVIGEEDTAGGQVLCLGGFLFLLGDSLWPHGRVGRRGSAGRRRRGSWSSGARDPRHPLGTPGSVHKFPAVSSGHTCGSLTAGNREFQEGILQSWLTGCACTADIFVSGTIKQHMQYISQNVFSLQIN